MVLSYCVDLTHVYMIKAVPYRRLHHQGSLSTQAPYGLKHVDCPIQLDSLKGYINGAKRSGTTATIAGKKEEGEKN